MAAGRGPRGWRRPDERILDELCERVERAGIDASDVEVRCTRGVLRLVGRVPSADERTFLEELAPTLLGVVGVECDIRSDDEDVVVDPDPETRH